MNLIHRLLILNKSFTGDPDSMTTYPDTKFTSREDVQELAAANLDECIYKLFKEFKRYAAEFDNDTQKCTVKQVTNLLQLPKVYEIEPSTDGKMVVHKNSKPVTFNSTIKSIEPMDWPCLSEPVSESSAPLSTLLTSTIDPYTSSVSARYSTLQDHTANETHCLCHSTKSFRELDREPLLNKKSLSRFKRKKVSASDPRVSSTAIGCFGAVILVAVCCVIIIADLHSIFMKARIKPKCKDRRKME